MILYSTDFPVFKSTLGYYIKRIPKDTSFISHFQGNFKTYPCFPTEQLLKEFWYTYSQIYSSSDRPYTYSFGNKILSVVYDQGFTIPLDTTSSSEWSKKQIKLLLPKYGGTDDFKFSKVNDLLTFLEYFDLNYAVVQDFIIDRASYRVKDILNSTCYIFGLGKIFGSKPFFNHLSSEALSYVLNKITFYKAKKENNCITFLTRKDLDSFLKEIQSDLCIHNDQIILNSIF